METVTIACPIGLSDTNVDPATAPIWTDGTNDYHVASGQLEGYAVEGEDMLTSYVTSEPILAQPNRVNVLVGMGGLESLAAMGLSPKVHPEV
jgi:hypothetical protein